MQQLLSSLEDERQRQFRRFVAFSAALHVTLAFLFWWSPLKTTGTALPAVVRVDLVTMADLGPAPKPAEVPAPKPAPPPPPPPQAKKVLPKQPAPLPKPKPVEAKPKPKPPEPKPKEQPKEEVKPPEPAPEQNYEDVLDQLRKEAGETAPKPVEQQAAAQPAGGPAGLGQVVSPEVARWIRDVKMHVTRAWILEPGFRLQALETRLAVEVSPTGEVLGIRKTQGSGNPWYDESVERAIRKASPLPPPPDAGEWPFSFKPSDLL